ncbi:3-methyl-2-oxobutanoate hydroxymethyltransferase [Ectothiorhodospiraceae bacterium 2226]|nr:3-methyl-2-oxobutanoate hydroxymethyltransferase [Ectothiorhodospiraceae bacterium 2226]
MSRLSLTQLRRMKREGTRIACLTAYDAAFATVLDEAGVDVLLVGDSLGMVLQGHDSTLPVTVDDMVYHCANVKRGSRHGLIVADLPSLSYATPERALDSAARLLKEGGAQVVKLEGGAPVLDAVRLLAAHGVPVCAHLGLLPQSVHKVGGYRVQGRGAAGEALLEQARALEAAGADLLVLECVPAALAAQVTQALEIPVIGIGAGAGCDGQVLVLYDMLGITPGKRPSFVHDFMSEAGDVPGAVRAYVQAVKEGRFPGPEHSFD